MNEVRRRDLADQDLSPRKYSLETPGIGVPMLALWSVAIPALALLAIADTRMAIVAVLCVIMVTLVRANVWRMLLIASLLLLIATGTHWPLLAQVAAIWRMPMLGALCLMTWLTTPSGGRGSRQLVTVERWVVGGFYGLGFLAILSALWSVAPSVTVYASGFLICLALTLHGLIARRWRDMPTLVADVKALLVALLLPAFMSIGLYMTGDVSSIGVGSRFQGIFANPNQLGQFGMLSWGVSVALFKLTAKYRYLALGMLPAILVALSGSRTAIGGLLVGAAILYVLGRPSPSTRLFRLSMLGALVLTAAESLVVLLSQMLPSLNRVLSGGQGDDTFNGRTDIWSAVVELIMQRPLLGYGYGVTGRILSGETGLVGSYLSAESVHQGYLQIVFELGLLGMVALGALMVGSCIVLAEGLGSAKVIGLTVSVSVGLFSQFAESSFLWPTHYFPLVLWASVAALLAIRVEGREVA